MKSKLIAAFSFVALAVAAIPAKAEDKKTIAGVIAGSKDHTILLALVKEAGLADKLAEKGEWTVFAPTDAAFKKLDEATLTKVKGDKELLTKILTSHATKGAVMAADVMKMDGKDVETLSGAKFPIHVKDKTVMIGDAKVTKADIKASNGVVHVVDSVLMPKM